MFTINEMKDRNEHLTGQIDPILTHKQLYTHAPFVTFLNFNHEAEQMKLLYPNNGIKDEINRILAENKLSTEENYHMSEKLTGDVLSALATSFCVAPFITIVDKAIVQRAAGSHTISKSVMLSVKNIVRHPLTYVSSPMFLMMWCVYASTYCTANVLKTMIEHEELVAKKNQEVPSNRKLGSFGITTLVNSGTSLMKDRAYATMFGSSSASNFPLVTYGLWGLRDCVVISSSFVFPEIMGKYLSERSNLNKKEAIGISQMICPVAAQLIATPLQLLGLDMYNRPMTNVSMYAMVKDRVGFVRNNFYSVTGARCARIAPAFGIGGIGNTYLRNSWRDMLIRREAHKSMEASHEGIRKYHTRRLVGLLATKHAGEHQHEAKHV